MKPVYTVNLARHQLYAVEKIEIKLHYGLSADDGSSPPIVAERSSRVARWTLPASTTDVVRCSSSRFSSFLAADAG